MSPEEQLCQRVVFLSSVPGVPPIVSAQLGQAVARYRVVSTPTGWAIARTLGFGVFGVFIAVGGLEAMFRLARSADLSADSVTWFCVSALASSLGLAAILVAADRVRRWGP